jgi:hypothetical protein
MRPDGLLIQHAVIATGSVRSRPAARRRALPRASPQRPCPSWIALARSRLGLMPAHGLSTGSCGRTRIRYCSLPSSFARATPSRRDRTPPSSRTHREARSWRCCRLNTALFIALPNGPRQPLCETQRSKIGCMRWLGVWTPQVGLTALPIIFQSHLIMPDAPVELR